MRTAMRKAIERGPTDDAALVLGHDDGVAIVVLIPPLRHVVGVVLRRFQRRSAIGDALVVNGTNRLEIGGGCRPRGYALQHSRSPASFEQHVVSSLSRSSVSSCTAYTSQRRPSGSMAQTFV